MKYVRLPVDDILRIGDETAVLLGDEVLLLSPLAAHLYELCVASTSLQELAASLEATFGSPMDTDLLAATKSAADLLESRGLLQETTEGHTPAPSAGSATH